MIATSAWNPGRRRTAMDSRTQRAHRLRRALAPQPAQAADRGLASQAAAHQAAADRAALRCQLDGALLTDPAHFAHTLARNTRQVEAFLFATADAHHHGAARAAGRRRHRRRGAIRCRTGRGTRIGAALRTFLINAGPPLSLHGGPVVLRSPTAGTAASHRCCATDRATAAQLPPPDHAQPADRHAGLAPLTRGVAGGACFVDVPAGPDAA